MISWILLVTYSTSCIADHSSNEAHYECGPHGKFEYCIDGVPGCVIGCHCHPGYYFDTDSKICEPNIKLANDFRRHYFVETTRVPTMILESANDATTLTTLSPIDQQVDAIAKDTDDLGDWLYNQFFKTIENQVINKTDGELLPETRRSSRPVKVKSKRTTRKRSKGIRKKHKIRKGLRKKLMRITEDDSLFDSSSDSEYDSDSSSSYESSSDSDSYSNEEHGHRKIIMVNKKKTPELPSFIFLPNVETPFYPPIGLPAPPILPMYPMIPIPPVPPVPVGPPDLTTTTPASSNDTTSTTTTETTTTANDTKVSSEEGLRSSKQRSRNKLMQKMLKKLRKKNRQSPMIDRSENVMDQSSQNDFQDKNMEPTDAQEPYPETPPSENVDFKYISQLIHKIDQNKTKPDIPFNLRSHGAVNSIQIRRSNPVVNDIPKQYFPPLHYSRPASKADDVNDEYYANLGRQIASLIRKVDSNGARQVNVEIDGQHQFTPVVEPMFAENSYSSHSYWERFVRSPIKNMQTYLKSLLRHKHSNENLVDLENQANVFAELERGLSLQELENIATMIRETRRHVKNKHQVQFETSSPNAKSFNVNLLPLVNIQNNLDIKKHMSRNKAEKRVNLESVNPHYNMLPFMALNRKQAINVSPSYPAASHSAPPVRTPQLYAAQFKQSTVVSSPARAKLEETLPLQHITSILRPPLHSLAAPISQLQTKPVNETLSHKNTRVQQSKYTVDMKKINYISNLLKAEVRPTTLHRQVSKLVDFKNTTRLTPFTYPLKIKYQKNPRMLNYKPNTNLNGQFQNQHRLSYSYAVNLNPSSLKKYINDGKSSYFHHEMHHFDYFD